jgi:hypothetical protein
MEQENAVAEIQALLASLKSSLAASGEPVDDAQPISAGAEKKIARPSGDLLPDHRALRRFILLV